MNDTIVLEKIKNILEFETGHKIDVNNLRLKLNTRILQPNKITLTKYYEKILDNKKEKNRLVDVMLNNKTFFFRNKSHFEILKKEILPKYKNKRLNIWSAGCSIGCEPYSIAILIREFGIKNYNIIATDLSDSALDVAKKGLYLKSEIYSDDLYYSNLINKYFKKQDEYYVLSDTIKNMVKFKKLNLIDFKQIDLLPVFDVIFYRNVLIYFKKDIVKKIVDKFYEKLDYEGYIFLGHSEYLSRYSNKFSYKKINGNIVYYKDITLRKGEIN